MNHGLGAARLFDLGIGRERIYVWGCGSEIAAVFPEPGR
jgi:hypothetical protein